MTVELEFLDFRDGARVDDGFQYTQAVPIPVAGEMVSIEHKTFEVVRRAFLYLSGPQRVKVIFWCKQHALSGEQVGFREERLREESLC